MMCRVDQVEEESLSSLTTFNSQLNAWLERSTACPAHNTKLSPLSQEFISSASSLFKVAGTDPDVMHAADAPAADPCDYKNSSSACMEDSDVDLFYLPPPPRHVFIGLSVATGVTDDTLEDTSSCSSATLTTSAQLPSNPQCMRSDMTVSQQSITLDLSTAETLPNHRRGVDRTSGGGKENLHPSGKRNIPECSTPRGCLARTQELLQRLQSTLSSKQNLLEDLSRVRARHRALRITELVSQKQTLQRQVDEAETLVATLLEHERELHAAKSRCEAQVRVSVATAVKQGRQPASFHNASYSHLHTDEVYASCGVKSVWQGAKCSAKSLKLKTKSLSGRAKAAMNREQSDDSMHGEHAREPGTARRGEFIAVMECTRQLPRTHSIALSELATRYDLLF